MSVRLSSNTGFKEAQDLLSSPWTGTEFHHSYFGSVPRPDTLQQGHFTCPCGLFLCIFLSLPCQSASHRQELMCYPTFLLLCFPSVYSTWHVVNRSSVNSWWMNKFNLGGLGIYWKAPYKLSLATWGSIHMSRTGARDVSQNREDWKKTCKDILGYPSLWPYLHLVFFLTVWKIV